MREILFRGKRVNDGKWVEGYYHEIEVEWDKYEYGMLPTKYQKVITPINFLTRELIEVIPETVGQDTGLRDKNGKKIFEGDIVRAKEKGIAADCEVKRRVDGIYYMNPNSMAVWYMMPKPNGATTVEVIGNIHDDPELLGE